MLHAITAHCNFQYVTALQYRELLYYQCNQATAAQVEHLVVAAFKLSATLAFWNGYKTQN